GGFDEFTKRKMTIGAIRLNTEIETQQNSRAGVAFFPAVQPPAMPRRYGASYRRGGLQRWPLLVLEPSARTIAAWQRRTNVRLRVTSPRTVTGHTNHSCVSKAG